MKFWLALAMVSFAGPAVADDGDHNGCGTYSDDGLRLSSGSVDCVLHRAGEKPLWQGLLPADNRQHIRFTLTPVPQELR